VHASHRRPRKIRCAKRRSLSEGGQFVEEGSAGTPIPRNHRSYQQRSERRRGHRFDGLPPPASGALLEAAAVADLGRIFARLHTARQGPKDGRNPPLKKAREW